MEAINGKEDVIILPINRIILKEKVPAAQGTTTNSASLVNLN
jgi:hypothetical protein